MLVARLECCCCSAANLNAAATAVTTTEHGATVGVLTLPDLLLPAGVAGALENGHSRVCHFGGVVVCTVVSASFARIAAALAQCPWPRLPTVTGRLLRVLLRYPLGSQAIQGGQVLRLLKISST